MLTDISLLLLLFLHLLLLELILTNLQFIKNFSGTRGLDLA